jgi:prepilin-type N-terminal cleavage/methylation domain-containing protein
MQGKIGAVCAEICNAGVIMRKAFTLIELLVVIFIITFLIAILMPAVQYAREAARTIRCTNNQKNLALGLIHYENNRGSLPGWRDFITVTWQGEEVAAQASWVFSILPYIEQTDLFERLRTGQVVANSEDTSLQIPTITILHCPSHRESPMRRAMTYVVNGGAVDNFHPPGNPQQRFTPDANIANGPFLDRCMIVAERIETCLCGGQCRHNRNMGRYRNAVARLSDISRMDGTSNTLLLSENVQRGFWISEQIVHFYHAPDGQSIHIPNENFLQLPEPDGRWIVPLTGIENSIEGSVAFCWPRSHRNPQQPLLCQVAYPTGQNGVGNPFRGFIGVQAPGAEPDDGLFEPPLVPGVHEPSRMPVFLNRFRQKEFSTWYQSARPSSNHATIVIVSLADGNVRRISDSISELVFVQLMTAGDAQSDAGWQFQNPTPPHPPAGAPNQNFLYGRLFNSPF